MQKPVTNKSEVVYQNPWYRVRRDELTWANGNAGEYFVTEIPSAAITICVNNGKLLMIKLFRYPIQQESIEFPGGAGNLNEDPLLTAQRELQEETGYAATHWQQLGTVFGVVGAVHAKLSIFLAQGITLTDQAQRDATEENSNLEPLWLSETEIKSFIKEGRMVSEEALSAWALYREWKDSSAT